MSSQPSYNYQPNIMPVNRYKDPTESLSALSKSIGGFFANRSFRRLFGIIGCGSTALVAYYLYSKYSESSDRKDQKSKEQISSQKRPFVIPEDKIEKYDYEAATNNANNNNEETILLSESEAKAKKQSDMVILYQVPRGFFTPAVAPFAFKLETFMRVAKIPYTVHLSTTSHEVSTPWMRVGDDEIRDTHDCIKFLQRKFNLKLDGMASASRKTACRMVDAVLDGHLYWAVSLWRWVYDEGKSLKDIQPMSPTGDAVLETVRDHVNRSAYYNGLGRLSEDEVVRTAVHDLAHLSSVLGKHPYFFGDSPGETDCNAFSIFSTMLWNMPGSPFEIAIKKQKSLIEYIIRMRENYWPDWNNIINSYDTNVQATKSCSQPSSTVTVPSRKERGNDEDNPPTNTGASKITSTNKSNLTNDQIETMQNLHRQIILQEMGAERQRQGQLSSNTRSQPQDQLPQVKSSGGFGYTLKNDSVAKFGTLNNPSMFADINDNSQGQVSQDEVSNPEQLQTSLQRALTQTFGAQVRVRSQGRLNKSKSYGFPEGYFNTTSRPATAITRTATEGFRLSASQSRPSTAQPYHTPAQQQPQQHQGQVYNRLYQ